MLFMIVTGMLRCPSQAAMNIYRDSVTQKPTSDRVEVPLYSADGYVTVTLVPLLDVTYKLLKYFI